MDDKTKLTDETNFPIPVPSTDTGWEAMRKRLDDEMPAAAAIFANKETEPRTSNKMLRLLLLLLLFFVTGSVVIMIRKDGNDKNIHPGTISEKYSSGDKTKQDDKLNDKTNTIRDIITVDNSNEPDKKDIGSDLSSHEPGTKNTSPIDQHREIVAGNKNQQAGLSILKNSKTGKNRNAMVKRNTSKKTTSHPDTKNQSSDAALLNNKYMTGKSTSTSNSPDQKTDSLVAAIAKSKTNAEKKPDSLAVDTPIPPSSSGWKLDGGAYWVLQVPTAATAGYFLGADAHSQPYRIILPGAWLEAQNEKHLLTLELNPFASGLLPAKAFRTVTSYKNIPDTTVVTVETKALRKVFGLSAGLGYACNVSGNWWLGGHVQSVWWRKAVATSVGEIQKYPTNGSPAITIPVKENYSINDEWSYFSRIQFYLAAEGIYRESKWQAGLRMGIGVTPLASNEGPTQSLRLELLYRLRLFNIKIAEDIKRDAWFR